MTDYDGCSDYDIPSGTIVCSVGASDDASLKIVKDWIETKQYTTEEVKIMRGDSYINVVAKQDLLP